MAGVNRIGVGSAASIYAEIAKESGQSASRSKQETRESFRMKESRVSYSLPGAFGERHEKWSQKQGASKHEQGTSKSSFPSLKPAVTNILE